jgi:hypothetical protein
MFFFSAAQRKYFVANEQDIKELSLSKIIIIDTEYVKYFLSKQTEPKYNWPGWKFGDKL